MDSGTSAELGALPPAASLVHVPLLPTGAEGLPLREVDLVHMVGIDTLASSAVGGSFFLGESFAPIPQKLVQRIQTGEFVDMADLLPDNLELRRREDNDASSSGTTGKRRARTITNLLTWVQCFATYAAVVGEKYPNRTRDLLAYIRLVVREAQRNGGDGCTIRCLGSTPQRALLLPSLYVRNVFSRDTPRRSPL